MTKFEILPYHDMAKPKYLSLKLKYALANTIPPSHEDVVKAMNYIKQGMQQK